ncbi:MAG: ribbon-helix-helix protein, CopG family [Acidobacteria bacterium]|nr:ribbon-helix-helix protein, CopG family [Acidobacteriota bacterium]
MRTTLTLDADVAARLEHLMRKRRRPLKAVVNEALRAGLDAIDKPAPARKPFRTKGFDLGPSLIGSLDNIEEVLSRAEGDQHR